MTRRPLHLLAMGLLAVATTTLDAAGADNDRSPRLRRGSDSQKSTSSNNSSSNNSNSGTQGAKSNGNPSGAQKFQRPTGSVGTANQNSGGNSSNAQIEAFRNRLQQRNQSTGQGTNSGGASSRNFPQLPNGNPSGNGGNSTIVPNAQLRDRLEQFRGQNPSGNSTRNFPQSPNNQNPAGNRNSGNAPNSQMRDRLEQFRGQNPSGSNQGNSGSNATDRGNLNVDQLRDRFQQQLEQGRKDAGRGNSNGPSGAPLNSDRLKDGFPNLGSGNTGNSASNRDPKNNVPSLPNLDAIRDRLESGRVETRKPDLSNPGKTDADRLRDRLKGLNPSGNDSGLPNLPGNIGRNNDGSRLDLTRRGIDRDSLKIEPNTFDRLRSGKLDLNDQFRDARNVRNVDDLRRHFDRLNDSPDVRNVLQNTNLKLNDFSGAFQTKIGKGSFNNIVQTNIGRKFDLDRQFNLFATGDVTRQLNLNQTFIQNGGWSKRSVGPVYSKYTSAAFSAWYPGPAWYPSYCWTPIWSPWVQWTFWDFCRPIYDPRPIFCRPIYYYDPCPPIVYYDYPVWQPLPVVTCGTWVDVPLTVVPSAYDVQLLAVRFVDPGHPEENLGPRYRVWLRNNSNRPIQSPFNVMLVAANDENLIAGLPQAGVTVEGMDPEQVVPVDIRLPMDANRMNLGPEGKRTPFTTLHVLSDSHRELPEIDESNNGLVIGRGDILPVDPAAFSTDTPSTYPGAMVSLAGEGFGPEPGQLIVTMGNQQVAAQVHGWYDLGIYFQMPNFPTNGLTTAQVLVIRGDGAASNPVTVELAAN